MAVWVAVFEKLSGSSAAAAALGSSPLSPALSRARVRAAQA